MARKVQTVLIDDIEGTELPDGGGQTITFSVDGATYEIDLSHKNAKKMRDALQFYSDHGRRVSGRDGSSALTTQATATRGVSDRERLKGIREWAKANGHQVSDRGRVSKQVQDAYDALQR